MAQTNARVVGQKLTTHEGAPASRVSAAEQLRRTIMSTLLWEDNFYEDGVAVADRIKQLVAKIDADTARQILTEAKVENKLRHAPLWMALAMLETGKATVEDLASVITRADDLTEILALYWKDGKKPLAHKLKDALAVSFPKFGEYHLAKYNRDKAVKLRDVLRLARPKPVNEEQSALWKKLVKGELVAPDTWEVALSGGADKKETFERLIKEEKLGDLAFLRNLRKMQKVAVPVSLLKSSLSSRSWKYILPYQFITAARYAPKLESELEVAMLKSLASFDKIEGKVGILVDVSISMLEVISTKSELSRIDVAAGVAMLAREVCKDVTMYTFNNSAQLIPSRRGFALRDAIGRPRGGTELGRALCHVGSEKFDLVVVITDEQSQDIVDIKSANAKLVVIVNVANAQNGVGYGPGAVHISGWSENVITYIQKYYTEYVK